MFLSNFKLYNRDVFTLWKIEEFISKKCTKKSRFSYIEFSASMNYKKLLFYFHASRFHCDNIPRAYLSACGKNRSKIVKYMMKELRDFFKSYEGYLSIGLAKAFKNHCLETIDIHEPKNNKNYWYDFRTEYHHLNEYLKTMFS